MRDKRIAMTPISPLRLAMATLLVALATPGCTRLLNPDPLNKTESIVNGTQVTRGPSRGIRGTVDSGFASTAAPTGNSFEPAVGEPFGVEELVGLPDNYEAMPELQGIDFGAEQGFVSDIASSGIIPADENSAEYFTSNIGQSVYFDTDSSELNERSRETLRRQAAWLNVNAGARVIIEGHADERGTREYNLALGDRRASATRGYLIAVGVDESRIDKTSYGKERPVALGSNEDAWAQNRRTETVIEGGETFAQNPYASAPLPSTGSEDLFPATPVTYDTMAFPGTTTLDPLTTSPIAGDTYATPDLGTITYDAPSSVYSAPGIDSQTQIFDSGSIAPTVFETQTVSPPPYGIMVPVTPTTTAGTATTTRIEDVSVDDLLRDPSLIDRIGTPGATTPGS